MARQTKLTPLIQHVIVKALEGNATHKLACEWAGINVDTFYLWMSKGKAGNPRYSEFSDAVTRARVASALAALAIISEAATLDWRAAAWLLERRHPDEYGRHAGVQKVAIKDTTGPKDRLAVWTPPSPGEEAAYMAQFWSVVREQERIGLTWEAAAEKGAAMTGLNVVTLLGQVTDRGVATHQHDAGAVYATFTIDVRDDAPTGSTFHLWVTIECYGYSVAAAEALRPGDAVAIEGKLKSTAWTDKTGQKQRRLVVLARTVRRLSLDAGVQLPLAVPEQQRSLEEVANA